MERLRGNHALSAALTGITAAVVGVIANLALYFAVHTLFTTTRPWRWGPLRLELPELASLRPVPLIITAAALMMVFRLRWSVPRTLAVCAGLGLAAALAGLPISYYGGGQRVWPLKHLTCTDAKMASPHLIAPVITGASWLMAARKKRTG